MRCLGALPGKVASDWAVVDLVPTWLWLCESCDLRFRNPIPPAATILNRYTGLRADEHWHTGIRPIWPRVRSVIMKSPERSILDVGCFRGDLLEWLGPEWDRYGIEPSASAATAAAAKGIRLLGSSLDDPALCLPRLGAITLVDVIEHLPRPLDALRRLAAALIEGGRLVIFTGDTDALSWRISGTLYWYTAIPEHITFFNPFWFRWVAPRLSCSVGTMRRLAHDPAPAMRRLADTAYNLAYLVSRRVQGSWGVGRHAASVPGLTRLGRFDFAWWTSARDHVLVELVKTGHA